MLCVNPSVTQIVHDEVFCCTDLVAILVRACYIPRPSRPTPGGSTSSDKRGERGDSVSAFMRADQETSFGPGADGKKGKGGAAELSRSPFLLPEVLQLPHDQLQLHLQHLSLSHQDLSAFLNRVFLEDAANISTAHTALALQHVCWSRGAHESARVLTFLADKVADCAMQTTGVDLAYRPYFRCISELFLSRALDSSFALDSVLPALLAKVPPYQTPFSCLLTLPMFHLSYELVTLPLRYYPLILPLIIIPGRYLFSSPPSHFPLLPTCSSGGRIGITAVPQRRRVHLRCDEAVASSRHGGSGRTSDRAGALSLLVTPLITTLTSLLSCPLPFLLIPTSISQIHSYGHHLISSHTTHSHHSFSTIHSPSLILHPSLFVHGHGTCSVCGTCGERSKSKPNVRISRVYHPNQAYSPSNNYSYKPTPLLQPNLI